MSQPQLTANQVSASVAIPISESVVLEQPERIVPEQILQRILVSGKITAADRVWFLKAAISDLSLNTQQLIQVSHVADRLQMGLVKVVD